MAYNNNSNVKVKNTQNQWRMNSENLRNYTSVEAKQQQSVFPRRSRATQKSLLVSMIIYLPWFVARNLGRPPPLPTGWHQFDHEKQNQNRKLNRNRNHGIKEDKQEAETQLKHEMEDGKQEAKVESEPCHRGGTKPFSWDTEKKEKKGDKRRNQSRNQDKPGNHDGTELLSCDKKEERRRETSTGTRAGTTRNQQIMMEQGPCLMSYHFSLLHWFVCETFSG